MSSAPNDEAYSTMRWVLDNARNGFYLFIATPPMQRRVADYFSEYDIAVYDYGINDAPYSYADLAKWEMQQEAKIFFIINMQIALLEESDIVNFNLSRDLLTKTDIIWVFGMTSDTDDRFARIASDLYSFIRLQSRFMDEGSESGELTPIADDIPSDRNYDSYGEAKEQMDRYAVLCEELLALPMDTEPERLLSAAATIENIADAFSNYGNYSSATNLYMRTKEIREKVLGEEHPDTATTYNNIAGVYDSQGDYHQALEWYCKSYSIILRELGDSHPFTAIVEENMKAAYIKTGASESFEKWYNDNFFPSDTHD